uniref:Phosphoserine phosphatase n=1 Tax=Candidatus Kentrum eta TaxID=2126337 RepID=A0A450ULQ0_9GAMM|nr:MAG: Phosphoserine phosphatase [Candidatus Kentron sp. H]VFJ93466.1 MAG: Phosphoserine phosphatase [Candidatus Kentron sp. H]VFK00249.1 MAG: Phosphoserine phosphatase [Candidatus Kentron sp. H]
MNSHPPYRTAIVYDFDGTLARGNMQDHGLLAELAMDTPGFWRDVDGFAEVHDCDSTLIYLWCLLDEAKRRNRPITREWLTRQGARIPLFPGVGSWFGRMNDFARHRDLALEHYIISSGNHEIIAGTPIYHRFRRVFASKYLYDEAGRAIWPGIAINYTTKTQYLFRINKGVLNNWDDQRVNRWLPMGERPLPFTRMIFIGDGQTDIPSMKMVRYQGGFSIAVFDPDRREDKSAQEKTYRLISEDRVNFVAPADYRAGSQLEIIVRGIMGRFARDIGYRE